MEYHSHSGEVEVHNYVSDIDAKAERISTQSNAFKQSVEAGRRIYIREKRKGLWEPEVVFTLLCKGFYSPNYSNKNAMRISTSD